MREKFKPGNNFSVNEAGQIGRTVNRLSNVTGDGTITATASGNGLTLGVNIQKVLERMPRVANWDKFFPVLVWQDGGTTDGDKTHACNRTYQARTIDATSEITGTELGTGLTPLKDRWAGNYGLMNCPAATGTGR